MIELHVVGIPASQGSMRGFVVGKKGGPQRAIVVAGGSKVGREKLGSWRQDVIDACQRYREEDPNDPGSAAVLPLRGPVSVSLGFLLPRPKSAPKSRQHPAVRPDVDKIARATLDALKLGGLYLDDAQVCELVAGKIYATGQPGALIKIRELA